MNIQELKAKAKRVTENGLPFMEGREKLEMDGNLLDTNLTVDNYGFMKGEFGEYAVITFKEYPQHFVQGASVVTQAFKNLDDSLTQEEVELLIEEGFIVKFSKVKSKNKKNYVNVDFFPTEE